jgi:hypothetical protein
MKNFKIISIAIITLLVISIPLQAKKSSIIGKRHFSLLYGLSDHRQFSDYVKTSELAFNLPLTKRTELGFGANQSWVDEESLNLSTSQISTTTHREYSYFTNFKYHFLPNSIVNPFLMAEIGNIITDISQETNGVTATTELTKGIMFGGDQNVANTQTEVNFYYSFSIGEEFLYNEEFSFLAFYTFGNYDNGSFNILNASLGYWVLEKMYLDVRYKLNFNTNLSGLNLISRIQF